MEVYIDLNGLESCWYCYFFDTKGYRTTTTGFKNHIEAVEFAKKRLGEEIKIIFK